MRNIPGDLQFVLSLLQSLQLDFKFWWQVGRGKTQSAFHQVVNWPKNEVKQGQIFLFIHSYSQFRGVVLFQLFLFHYAFPTGNVYCFGMKQRKSKIALIVELVGDRAKRLKFGSFLNISKKITQFLKKLKKPKFALISETVRALYHIYILSMFTAKYFQHF